MRQQAALRLVTDTAPTSESEKVQAGRWTHASRRDREHLWPSEVDRLITAAGQVGRYRHRDRTLLLMAYRHGLRVSELVSLKWQQVDWGRATVHVKRLKGSIDSTHPLQGDELRALRRLHREQAEGGKGSAFMFTTERGGPMTTSNVRKMVERAGKLAGLGDAVHPHQLRHSCGAALAEQGVDLRVIQQWLGHASVTNTVGYVALSSRAFDGVWQGAGNRRLQGRVQA